MSTEKSKKLNRRGAFKAISGAILGVTVASTASATPSATPSLVYDVHKIPKQFVLSDNNVVVMNSIKNHFGLSNQYDVFDDVVNNKIRVGDGISESLKSTGISDYQSRLEEQLKMVMFNLTDSVKYDKQSMIDMKFMFHDANDSIKSTLNSYLNEEIELSVAQLQVRESVFSFFNNLESVPPSQ